MFPNYQRNVQKYTNKNINNQFYGLKRNILVYEAVSKYVTNGYKTLNVIFEP
jgi:hypothetical protein